MASAVLASQNESSGGHMGKIPYSNPHLNGNPNPKKRQKQFHHAGANGVIGRHHGNGADSPVVTQTASDDGYSFNQTSTCRRDVGYGACLTFKVASFTKSELLDLRKRLSSELDRIRDLRDRIASGQLNRAENPRSQPKSKKIPGNKRPVAALGSDPKKLCNVDGSSSLGAFDCNDLMKECAKIVAKLIKHKYGYVFKTPVDAVGLGLHDYHLIVKRPMDLGTVKSNIAKNLYASPVEFAADVRLTFNNAMLYNPKNDPYNVMAEQMLARFEDMFRSIQEKIGGSCVDNNRGREFPVFRGNDELGTGELQGSSLSNRSNQIFTSPVKRKKSKPKPKSSPVLEQALMQAHSSASTPSNPPAQIINHQQPSEPEQFLHSPVRAAAPTLAKELKSGRGLKLPKPRAKDPNKREMTMEEKHKLGLGLQNLPQEKMPQLLHIVRKRNDRLSQDGDEIELDIEALDTETVWELDRFVTNWKKMESKIRRQALMMNNNPTSGGAAPASSVADADVGALSDKNDDMEKKFRENEDEDVDIDDDMPETTFPPVEIEKDEGVGGGGGGGQAHEHDNSGNASSSSSSSGSSSSDSSSSSGTSSGSDSDAGDDAQS